MAKSKNRVASLVFPRAGLNKKLTYQNQPPFTTPDAQNVRPDNVYDYREGGGSRPGLNSAVRQDLGSDGITAFVDTVTMITNDGRATWRDDFAGNAMGDKWTARTTWDGVAATMPTVSNGKAVGVNGSVVGATLDNFDPILNGVGSHEVTLRIVPDGGSHRGTYYIYMLMGSGLNATDDGIVAELTLSASGAYEGNLYTYIGGVLKDTTAFASSTDQASYPGEFVVRVDAARTASVWWRHNQLVTDENLNSTPAAQTAWTYAYGRIGFGMLGASATGNPLVDSIRCEYYRNSGNEDGSMEPSRTTVLVAGHKGVVKHNDDGFYGDLGDNAATVNISTTNYLETAERLQKLYIADHGNVAVSGYAGSAATTTRLTLADISRYDDLGLNTNNFIVEISDATGDFVDGAYEIASIEGTGPTAGITLSRAFSAVGLAGTCTVNIERGPKVFDPSDGTLSLWVTEADDDDATLRKGAVPLGCELLCMWRDRLVLATGHLWYMSRAGNALDFNYGDDYEDVARAVAGSVSEAGYMGDVITAMIPHADECLIFGSRRSLWILRGDPAFGGQIDNLSYQIGIVGPNAWCYTPDKTLVFLSDDGIYLMSGQCGSLPQSFSRERLPDELLHTNWANARVSMAYDVEARGIYLFVSYGLDQAATHWWIDWETKSLWPVTLEVEHEPTALCTYRANDGTSSVLLACKDHQLRQFERDCWLDDDNTAITSYVMIGPLRLGPHDYFEGILSEITGVLHGSSGDVDWSIHVGDTPQEAIEASALAEGEWDVAGVNYTANPRCSGVAAIVKLTNDENIPWALEHVDIVLRPGGRRRIG